MNKIKFKINKKIISLIILIITIIIFIYPVYYINSKIRGYKSEVLSDYTKLAQLENEKSILNIYNQILTKDSTESLQIKKYILTSNRKEVLGLINELEAYTKKVGLIEGGGSPIVSVEARENAELSKYNAGDLVINIKVSGSEKNIDNFINIINNLPLISYIEKIDVRLDGPGIKNSANIVLVIYQIK